MQRTVHCVMNEAPKPRLPLVSRLLPGFLAWLSIRAVHLAYLGDQDAEYRVASEAGFGPALWGAELLFAFLGFGAAVGMWLRWRHTGRTSSRSRLTTAKARPDPW